MLVKLLNILRDGKDKLLYKIDDNTITYEDAYYMVLELSNNLRKQGSEPVVVYGDKSINQFISILACVVAKRCYIPIDINTPISRINNIITESNASLIISDIKIDINNIDCLNILEINDNYKNKDNYCVINNDIAYIIYTSGSTGKSKGVPISYNNLNNFIEWIINRGEFNKCNNINILSEASFSFDLSVMDIYFSIYKGCSIISINSNIKKDISSMFDIIKSNKINFLIMTPTFIKMLLIGEYFNSDNFPYIKYMFFCGECLEVEVIKKIKSRFKDINIINAYGPTEATCCVSLLKIEDNMLDKDYVPVGKISTAAVDINILDEEIILKGKSVFSGYLCIDSNNCYKEDKVNCYKTGDIGYIDKDYLFCNGRKDSQIKYMGYRIELGDIENNLLKIDCIDETVVVAKYKDNSNVVKMIKAFVVINKDVDEDYIKDSLKRYLPDYMIPKRIVILDSIPVNNNGKYDRKKISEL